MASSERLGTGTVLTPFMTSACARACLAALLAPAVQSSESRSEGRPRLPLKASLRCRPAAAGGGGALARPSLYAGALHTPRRGDVAPTSWSAAQQAQPLGLGQHQSSWPAPWSGELVVEHGHRQAHDGAARPRGQPTARCSSSSSFGGTHARGGAGREVRQPESLPLRRRARRGRWRRSGGPDQDADSARAAGRQLPGALERALRQRVLLRGHAVAVCVEVLSSCSGRSGPHATQGRLALPRGTESMQLWSAVLDPWAPGSRTLHSVGRWAPVAAPQAATPAGGRTADRLDDVHRRVDGGKH